jgi:hypothetical protein
MKGGSLVNAQANHTKSHGQTANQGVQIEMSVNEPETE